MKSLLKNLRTFAVNFVVENFEFFIFDQTHTETRSYLKDNVRI